MSEEWLLAVKNRRPLVEIKALIKPETNIDFQDSNGNTALHEATLNLDTETMKFLLEEKEANADLKDRNGQATLNHVFAEYLGDNQEDLIPAINLLLQYAKDPNPSDYHQDNLLKWSAFNGYVNIAKLLCARGAELTPEVIMNAENGAEYHNNDAMIAFIEDNAPDDRSMKRRRF